MTNTRAKGWHIGRVPRESVTMAEPMIAHIEVHGEPLCESVLQDRFLCSYVSLADARRAMPYVARALYKLEEGRDAPNLRGHHAVRVVRGECPLFHEAILRLWR
jgi:hypothetical protein